MAGQTQPDGISKLKTDLRAKEPQRLYFFYGEEQFLLRHYLQQLRNTILDELTEAFNAHRFTAENFDLQSFADAVDNLPMMAERTLVQLEDVDIFKLNEDGRSKMAELLGDIPPFCTVVFVYDTVDFKPDKRQKKLWEAISAGQIVEFGKQDQRSLISWVGRHFAARGKRIDPQLCAYLIEITDGTMTSLSAEIQKICAYSEADTVCKADVDAVTEPALDAVVFQMTDMLAAGDYAAALVTLDKLLKMHNEPIAILGAVGSNLRRLGAARTLLDHGAGRAELAKLCGLSDFAARKTMDGARRFSPDFFRQATELVLETDYKMKTSFDDSERLLEMLIVRLAQEARNG